MKYSQKIVDKICELLATGDHKIEDICNHVGISQSTFYEWKETKSEFSESIKEAESRRLDALAAMAQSGLAKLISGHEYIEEKDEFGLDKLGKPIKTGMSRTRKFIMPNPTAVIFTLTNRKPENWKQRQSIEHTGPNGGPIVNKFDSLTDDELFALAKTISKLKNES